MGTSNFSSARAAGEMLDIDHVGHRGDGVALIDGQTVFVPYTLDGESVETSPVPDHPDRRRLLRIDKPSPKRIAPCCPLFGACGGCAVQHWQAEEYRAWKRRIVADV